MLGLAFFLVSNRVPIASMYGYLPTRKPMKINHSWIGEYTINTIRWIVWGWFQLALGGGSWVDWTWWHVHRTCFEHAKKKMFQWELCTVICCFLPKLFVYYMYTCFFWIKCVCLVYLFFFFVLGLFPCFFLVTPPKKSNLQQNRRSSNCSKTHLYAGFGNGQAIGFH